jgi:ferrous iron transport protein A
VPTSDLVSLSSLRVGAEATVAEVAPPPDLHDAELVLRLIEIGFLPGERVRVIARGQPGDEPIAVRIGRSTFALRRFEAAFIRVQPVHQAAAVAQPTPPAGWGTDQRRALPVPAVRSASTIAARAARP